MAVYAEKSPPQIGILLSGEPLLLPAEDPALRDGVDDVFRIGVDHHVAPREFQRFERDAHGHQLHTVVGRQPETGRHLLAERPAQQHRPVTSRTGISQCRTVGIDRNIQNKNLIVRRPSRPLRGAIPRPAAARPRRASRATASSTTCGRSPCRPAADRGNRCCRSACRPKSRSPKHTRTRRAPRRHALHCNHRGGQFNAASCSRIAAIFASASAFLARSLSTTAAGADCTKRSFESLRSTLCRKPS